MGARLLHHTHTALHCTALHCTALHCTALHCTTVHNGAQHCITECNTTPNSIISTASHCTASDGITLQYTASNHTTLPPTSSSMRRIWPARVTNVSTHMGDSGLPTRHRRKRRQAYHKQTVRAEAGDKAVGPQCSAGGKGKGK